MIVCPSPFVLSALRLPLLLILSLPMIIISLICFLICYSYSSAAGMRFNNFILAISLFSFISLCRDFRIFIPKIFKVFLLAFTLPVWLSYIACAKRLRQLEDFPVFQY